MIRDWPIWAQFALSLGAVALALVARWLLTSVLGNHLPFVTVFSVLLLLVLVVRPGPFLAGALLALVGAWYLIVPPANSLRIERPAVELQVALFATAIIAATTTTWLSHRAQQRARGADAMLRAFVDESPTCHRVTDAQDRIVYANRALAEAIGRPLDEIVGCTHAQLLPAELAELSARNTRNVRESGAQSTSLEEIETPNGGGTRRILEWRRFALQQGDDGPVLVAAMANDVSEKLRAERALRESEQALRHRSAQLENIIDRAPLGVYLVDADFRIAKVNPVALPVFGDIPGGVVGRDFDEIIHILWEKDYADEVVRIFRHTLETGESYISAERAEYRLDRQETEYYEWRLDRITLPDGRYGLVCYFRDISQQVEARMLIERSRDALRQQDRRKDEFLATLAHELRNPLASLTTAVDLFDRCEGTEAADAMEALAIIRRQSSHMVRLLDDLLDVSRIARGRLVLQRERVELVPLCRRVVADISRLYQSRGHQITLSLPEESLWLNADSARLTQVIGNLLHNACKYTPAAGHIALSVRRDGRDALIAVSDGGIGIASEDLPRLFEPFAQVHSDPGLAQGGIGMGLSLVKRLVAMHGGSVQARSAGRGKGSTFELRLPALDAAIAPEMVPPAAVSLRPSASAAASNRRILVVDDNKDAAASLARLLTLGGDQTRIAHDGPEAIEAAEQFEPDLVLLDIGLPSINGYDVCRTIRAKPSGRKPVIVALTGWGQEEDRRQSAEAGFDHHLVKPVQFEKLAALLDVLMAGSSAGS